MRRRVFVQEIPDLRIAVLDPGGRIATIDKLPWFVEQERTTLTRIPHRPVRPHRRAPRSRPQPNSVSHRPGPLRPPHLDRADRQPRNHHRWLNAPHPPAERSRIPSRPVPPRPPAAGRRHQRGTRPMEVHLRIAVLSLPTRGTTVPRELPRFAIDFGSERR